MIKARDEIDRLKPYQRPAREQPRVKLDQNESPHDVPPDIKARLQAELAALPLNRYPEGSSEALRHALADYVGDGWQADNFIVGNGIDEVLYYIALTFLGPGRKVVYPEPSFPMYEICATMMGAEARPVRLRNDFSLPEEFIEESRGAIAFVCNPNAPTGNLIDPAMIDRVIEVAGLVILDQAYGEFAGLPIRRAENVITTGTFSKAFSAAALRLGYGIASETVIDLLNRVRLPWNLSAVAQRAGEILLQHRAVFAAQVRQVVQERERLRAGLAEWVEVFPSAANFLLFRSRQVTYHRLLERGVQVRDVSGYPLLEHCLRATVGTPAENDALVAAVREISCPNRKRRV